jgi:hypothetical protein
VHHKVYMERMVEKIGVPAIIALVAAIVLAYSLWGAYVLKQSNSKEIFSQASQSLTANL